MLRIFEVVNVIRVMFLKIWSLDGVSILLVDNPSVGDMFCFIMESQSYKVTRHKAPILDLRLIHTNEFILLM